MKVSDLMIGDLVRFDEDTCVIEELRVDGTAVLVAMNMDLTSVDGDQVDVEELYPIPLTAEILAKNFKSEELPDDPYGAYFFGGNDYIEVYIKEYTDGLWQVDVDEVEMGGLRTWRMFVSNVHELQHTLRLCGIDKEIEL